MFGRSQQQSESGARSGRVARRVAFLIVVGAVFALAASCEPPPGGPNVLTNPSLEASTNGVADCWQHGGFGTNVTSWARVSDAHTGSWAEKAAVWSYTDGDVKLVSRQDAGPCAPTAITGHTYDISTWYKSSAPVRLVAYYHTTAGAWVFWAQSPTAAPATNTYTKVSWITPAFPAGADRISVGLSLRSVGTMTTDDWALNDGDKTAPTVSLTQPTAGAVVSGTAAPFAATASDASGIAKVEFLVNGTVRGSDTSAPYTFAWNSTTIPDGTASVAARATDTASNVTTSPSVSVNVDNTGTPPPDTTPPVSTITCNGAACSAGWYNAPVTVALSATDAGTGVANIKYTTNGSDPQTSGTTYTAPFSVPATATVQFSAKDVQGNIEATRAQAVKIDTVVPTAAITCNGTTCSAGAYPAAVQVALSGTDTPSGVASIRYTTNGSDPTATSTAYSAPFSVGSTTTVKYRAFDNAGNAGAVGSRLITVTAPPVSTVVSLGFDDSSAGQSVVPGMLDARGMKGTFFVNSGEVGTAGYMTWPQIDAAAQSGHEIAGHTLHHVHLDDVSAATAQTEICQDRTNLLARGYNVTNFAYPYGEGYDNASVRSIVQGCGYSSARMAWGLWYDGCDDCDFAETVPPVDKWATRAGDSVEVTDTLADIEAQVTRAEQNGGGWLQLVFHKVCTGSCDQYSVSPANLSAFLDWLQARSAQGTVVKTTQQVLSGG